MMTKWFTYGCVLLFLVVSTTLKATLVTTTPGCFGANCETTACVGEHCDRKCSAFADHRPEFLKTEYQFMLAPPTSSNESSVVGHIKAEYPGNIKNTECDEVVYLVLENNTRIPIEVKNNTGEILVTNWTGFESWPKSYSFTVMARNPRSMSYELSQTTVTLTRSNLEVFNRDESSEARRREKRATESPPGELTFSMSKLNDPSSTDLCRGCMWDVEIVIGLPAGTHSPKVELFGASNDSGSYGFVDEVKLVKQGSRITSNVVLTTNPIVTGTDSKVSHMAVNLGSITVESTNGVSQEDFQIVIQFKMGLSVSSAATDSTKLTGGAGALLDETLWIGVLNVNVLPAPEVQLRITNCPDSVFPGDMIMLDVATVLPFAAGDYEFEVNSNTPAVSIQHVEFQPGAGFGSTLQKDQVRTIDTQDGLVLGKSVQTKIKGANNMYATEKSRSDEERGIRITVFAQVSPFAATRTSITVYGYMPDQTLITSTCMSGIKTEPPTNTQTVAELQPPTGDAGVEAGKSASVYYRLIVPVQSSQVYSIKVGIADESGVELGYATVDEVTSVISNFRKGLPLLTSFTRSGDENLLLTAQIFLGTIENKDPATPGELTVLMKIKQRPNSPGTPVSLNAVFNWVGGLQDPLTYIFTPGAQSAAIDTIPTEKEPQLSITKTQPSAENSIDKYATVLLMSVKFASDFVYAPVKFQLRFSDTEVKLLDMKFEIIDECLTTIVPVGLEFIQTGAAVYELQLDSIYCASESAGGSVSFRLVVSKSASFNVIAGLFIKKLSTKQIDITVDPFNPPHDLNGNLVPTISVSSASMSMSAEDPFIYPGVNLLFVTLTIHPSTKQKYELQVSTTDTSEQSVSVCHPRLLNFDSNVGFQTEKPTKQLGIIRSNMGYIFYKDSRVDTSSAKAFDRHTITYAVPVQAKQNGDLSGTAKLLHGTLSVAKTFGSKVSAGQAGPSKATTATSGRLSLFDFDAHSNHAQDETVAPGEVVKFYYTFTVQMTKCASYSVSVYHSKDAAWPLDLSGIYVHSHGGSIWCLDSRPDFTAVQSTDLPTVIERLNLDLGTICTHGTTASWVRLLIYTRPWSVNPSKNGAQSAVQFLLKVDLTEDGMLNSVAAQTLQFTLDPNQQMTVHSPKYPFVNAIEFPPNVVTASPGREVSVTAKIRVPPAGKFPSSSVTFYCNEKGKPRKAACTVSKIAITAGANFASTFNEPFETKFRPTADSGQLNEAMLVIGNLVHTGVAQSLGLEVADADILTAVATVKLADSVEANNGEGIPINVSVQFAQNSVSESTVIRVERTGAEIVDLDLVSEILTRNEKSSFYPGETIQIRINRTMKETSQLECQEQKLQVHHGNVFTEVTLVSQSVGVPQFQLNAAMVDPRITEFTAGGLFFDQSAWVTLNMEVSPHLTLPNGLFFINTSPTFELICMANPRSDPTPMDGVGGRPARFVTMQKIPVALPGGCMKSLGLGDETKIRDCQITSFASGDPNHRAPNIRYKSTVGWKPPVRSGEYSRYRYVDIMFGKMTVVKEIRIELISGTNKVVKLDIYGTNDGRAYFFNEQGTITYQNQRRGSILLTDQLQSRGLRLVVSEQEKEDEEVTFTIDLWGCDEVVDVNPFDPCNLNPFSLAPKSGFLPPPFIVEPRVFLYANGQFFFCDLTLDPFVTFSNRKRCYRAADTVPTQWFDLGPTISQVLTYLPTENIIFGIGSDRQSLVQSSDLGRHWKIINRSAYQVQVIGAASSVNATAIPWSIIPGKFDAATKGTACVAYTGGSWYICYDGIYRDAHLYVDWNTKCPKFSASRI